MLYAFLGSLSLGGLATALLLWRKSVVEKALVASQASEKDAQDRANRALSELELQRSAFTDQLARSASQLETVRIQRDQAISALAKSTTPGSIAELLRLRNKVPTT